MFRTKRGQSSGHCHVPYLGRSIHSDRQLRHMKKYLAEANKVSTGLHGPPPLPMGSP